MVSRPWHHTSAVQRSVGSRMRRPPCTDARCGAAPRCACMHLHEETLQRAQYQPLVELGYRYFRHLSQTLISPAGRRRAARRRRRQRQVGGKAAAAAEAPAAAGNGLGPGRASGIRQRHPLNQTPPAALTSPLFKRPTSSIAEMRVANTVCRTQPGCGGFNGAPGLVRHAPELQFVSGIIPQPCIRAMLRSGASGA
jgi:hypothetical protein